jgi:hypothetical protein
MEYNVNEIVNHINTLGICVLEDYFTEEECKQGITELDYCFDTYKNKAQVLIHEGCGGDERLFSIERQSTIAKKFADDELLSQVCSKYLGEAGRCHQVLAGKLTADKDKVINSGGGWHRDSNTKQFKAIAYLSNCTEKNGPYMFIPSSVNLRGELRQDMRGTRFTDQGIRTLCESNNIKPFVVTAKAGTVILTATNNIHRGANIEEGKRYSLTSYYYAANIPTKKTWEEWSVPVK